MKKSDENVLHNESETGDLSTVFLKLFKTIRLSTKYQYKNVYKKG